MKKLVYILLLIPFIGFSQSSTVDKLKGPYLGQNPPGIKPEIFASGIISTELHEFSCTMSPNGKAFYFTRRVPEFDRNRIMVTYLTKEGWTQPVIAPKAGEYEGMEPYITNDGNRFYFQSWKPYEGNAQPSMDIWVMEKQADGWGDPEHVDPPFNPGKAMYISMANNQTIYTTDISKGFNPTSIVFSENTNGKYQEFQSVGEKINLTGTEIYPCIAPDESFLLFVRATPEKADLFVSFRQKDNNWSEPILIDLGLKKVSMPFLSPEGKYLFFTSSSERLKGDIYWVSAKIIEKLKPETF